MKTVGITCYNPANNPMDKQLSFAIWQDGKVLVEEGTILQSRVFNLPFGHALIIQAINSTTGDNDGKKSPDNGGAAGKDGSADGVQRS